MSRSALPLAALLLALLLLPTAASAATCNVTNDSRKLGPTYTTKLTVTGTSCATGKRFVRSYYNCRIANGGRDGRCTRRVSGYTCREVRSNRIRTQYDARVTCRNGARRINHNYTQFT